MRRSCWLVSAPYDLSFIIGSAIVLFVPHAVHLLWPSNIVVDLAIAAAIGGPHLFATYTLTFMEPNFRRRYPRYTAGALLLPLLVLVTAIVSLDLLVTAFFLLAALHVIHQAGYVADSYRDRRPEPAATLGLSRLIDYGLLLSSLFVLATFKFTGAPLRIFGMELSEHQFATGGRRLLFPPFLQAELLAWMLMLAFVLCAGAFLVKSVYEAAQGRLNLPKTLHMVLAAGLFFVTPALQNLDVAFQGLNTWHSFQYLALVIFLNRCRQAQGLIGSPAVARLVTRGPHLYCVGLAVVMSRKRSRRVPHLYCVGLALTAACGVVYLALRGIVLLLEVWPGDALQQHYFAFYVAVLSALLIHYYFDHFLFLRVDGVINPRAERAAPATPARATGTLGHAAGTAGPPAAGAALM